MKKILLTVSLALAAHVSPGYLKATETNLHEIDIHPFVANPLSCADGTYKKSFLGMLATDILGELCARAPTKALMLTSQSLYTYITGFENYQVGSDARPQHNGHFRKLFVNKDTFNLENFSNTTVPSFTWSCLFYKVQNMPFIYWQDLEGTRISSLSFSNNNFKDEHLSYLSACLVNTNITELYINNSALIVGALNKFSPKTLNEFCKNMKNTQISTLYLDGLDINDKLIASLEIHGSNIKSLSLQYNNLRDEDLIPLFIILKKAQVNSLYLQDNLISDEGLEYIFGHINETNVTDLYIFENDITDAGARYALDNFAQTNLTALHLWGGDISEDLADELEGLNETSEDLSETTE